MTEGLGGTLVAERPSALITPVLGSTSGLTWERCELPIEAATCPVSWCQGIHADQFDHYINHERDIAHATRDGKLVIEVAVHRVVPVEPGSLYDSGDGFGVRLPQRPEICVFLYDATPVVYGALVFDEQTGQTFAFTALLRSLGEYEFAGAISEAMDLCETITSEAR